MYMCAVSNAATGPDPTTSVSALSNSAESSPVMFSPRREEAIERLKVLTHSMSMAVQTSTCEPIFTLIMKDL